MEITCNDCGKTFQFEIFGESFGLEQGSDFNMYEIECPYCKFKILIRTIVYYDHEKWNTPIP